MKAPPQRMPVPSSSVGATCVVYADDVEQRSQEGWKLAMVVQSQELKVPPSPNAHASWCRCSECQQHGAGTLPPVLVDVPRFVMFRGAEDEVTRARIAASEAEAATGQLSRECAELRQARERVEKENASLAEAHEVVSGDLARARALLRDANASKMKLEQDLAKVRREIGEAAWKRIVEAAS